MFCKMSVEIIRANEKDANTLSDLGRITYGQAFGALFKDYQAELDDYLTKTFHIQKIQSSLGRERNTFLLAYDGESPIGYAKMKKNSFLSQPEVGSQVQLQKIYVLEEYIGKKVGVALLQKVFELARLESAQGLWLSVLQSNERAIRFYEKFGFDKVSVHRFTIGSQEFLFYSMSVSLIK